MSLIILNSYLFYKNIKYETIDISDCSSLKEIVNTMKNNRFKIGVGSVGNLQSSNLKTLLSNPSGFGNYTLVQAEFITERMIHLYAITLGVTPPMQVDGYITYNNVKLSWSGWKSYVANSDLYTKIVDANFVNGEVSITINDIDVTKYSWSAVGRTGMTIITSILPENTNTLKLTARGWWDSTVSEGATRNIQLIGVKISS